MAEFLVKVQVDDVDGCSDNELGDQLTDSIYENCDGAFTFFMTCDHGEEHEEEGELCIRRATIVHASDIAREARPTTIGLPAHP